MTKPREEIAVASLRTPVGRIFVLASARGLREIRLGQREAPSRREERERGVRYIRRSRWTAPAIRALRGFLAGRSVPGDLPLDLACGTPFQRRVWEAARAVPWGGVASYVDLAKRSGSPRAARAVGNALGRNPVPIVIPCHRILHFDQSIGGFSSGLAWKRYLLKLEQSQMEIALAPRRRRLGLFR